MSPGQREGRPAQAPSHKNLAAAKPLDSAAERTTGDGHGHDDALFGVVRTPNAPGLPTRVALVAYDEPPAPNVRGPGPRPSTGPESANAPDFLHEDFRAWAIDSTRHGRTVTADEVPDRIRAYAGPSGAAVGAAFRKLAGEGVLVLHGYRPSLRASSRGRVVGVWGSA